MKTVEQSITESLDGNNTGLIPYLPYILQDFWEIGADPDIIVRLISKHHKECGQLKVLDLGCGKGAVSIGIARELGCLCHGIDAMSDFIEFAGKKAAEYGVDDLCRFETGDIRTENISRDLYDVVVLAATGRVLGNHQQGLVKASEYLKVNGSIIIDDGYIYDNKDYKHPSIYTRKELIRQTTSAGMSLVDEEIIGRDENFKSTCSAEMGKITRRCEELAEKYPRKKQLFMGYINNQAREYEVLMSENVCCSTMLFKRS